MNTRHADIRAQQRGIEPVYDQWLDLYGKEEYGGHGVIIRYFDKKAIRALERDFGRRFVAQCSEGLDAYKVVSTDGHTITIGHRNHRVWRR